MAVLFAKGKVIYMINSNIRKLSLSGWLKDKDSKSYETSLKLQKFLLLYESFAKISGEQPDFSHLRGYKRGPVFSNVWGDYTKERVQFDKVAIQAYEQNKDEINSERATICDFIVGTMSEKELSDFTHEMNLWKSKEKRIMAGEYSVTLDESDFNKHDENMICLLSEMYPIDMINNSTIISTDCNYFVFNKKDVPKLTEQHFDTLSTLSEQENLHNPVFVEIDEKGILVID